jgi:hypothetical protein
LVTRDFEVLLDLNRGDLLVDGSFVVGFGGKGVYV